MHITFYFLMEIIIFLFATLLKTERECLISQKRNILDEKLVIFIIFPTTNKLFSHFKIKRNYRNGISKFTLRNH